MSETTFMGAPREKIDWCPQIDYEKCSDCMECVEFCPHQVFEVREDQKPKLIVKNPANCVVFCRACAKTCGPGALSFPDKNKTTARIAEVRALAERAVEKIINSPEPAKTNQENASGTFFPSQLIYESYQKDKFIFRIPAAEGFYFNENEVWAYVSGNRARIGITDYIQKSLSDILYFTPPSIGARITQFGELGTIESAKAVFEVVSPVSGVVTAINEKLPEAPEALNQNPYEQGWIAEVELSDFEEDRGLLHTISGYMPILKQKVDEYHG